MLDRRRKEPSSKRSSRLPRKPPLPGKLCSKPAPDSPIRSHPPSSTGGPNEAPDLFLLYGLVYGWSLLRAGTGRRTRGFPGNVALDQFRDFGGWSGLPDGQDSAGV